MATDESSASSNAARAAAASEHTDHQDSNCPAYEYLRALLSLENPTCQICAEDIHELNANNDNCASCHDNHEPSTAAVANQRHKVRLVPMPHCKCRTTLASMHVRPSELPLPPSLDSVNTTAADQPSFLQQLLNSQPCLSGDIPRHKRMGAFTARKPPTITYSHLTTCTECLPQWTKSSNDVQRYTYNDDPQGNEMCFTNDVRCAQCQRVFAKRTVDRLLMESGGGGNGGNGGAAKEGAGGRSSKEEDEWTRSVEYTARVVAWADGVKAWARRELMNGDADSNGRGDAEQQLTPEQSHLRSVLLSVIRDRTAPSLGEDGVHRQEVQHGEMKRELMQRDPKFAQEVEDEEYVRKLAEEEEREAEEERRRRQEADERMARELHDAEREGGGGSAAAAATNTAAAAASASASASTPGIPAIYASHQKRMRLQREEEEKKSEELARRMQQEWEEEERRERERREKRDAKLARKLYNADRREKKGMKRKGSPTPLFGEPVRKSPFDSPNRAANTSTGEQSNDDVVDITDSPTKAAGGDTSDDEYVRLPPSASKNSNAEKASEEKAPSEKEKDEVHPQDLFVNNKDQVDNNDNEQPHLFMQAASPFPTPRAVDTSARKRPPPTTTPSSNRKPPPMQANSTPRHRSGSKQGADFSADRKKEEDWDEGNDSDLQFLIDMGFDWKEAKSCYLDADKHVEKAAAMLSSAMEERERAKKRG